MGALPYKFRRAASIAIPIFSALAFLGIITGLFKISLTENLVQTGITLGIILGLLNGFAAWLAIKHQVP